jgi:hypothetical protein
MTPTPKIKEYVFKNDVLSILELIYGIPMCGLTFLLILHEVCSAIRGLSVPPAHLDGFRKFGLEVCTFIPW